MTILKKYIKICDLELKHIVCFPSFSRSNLSSSSSQKMAKMESARTNFCFDIPILSPFEKLGYFSTS